MEEIKVPETIKVTVDGFDGFEIIVPNHTDVRELNLFLAKAMDWTEAKIQQARS